MVWPLTGSGSPRNHDTAVRNGGKSGQSEPCLFFYTLFTALKDINEVTEMYFLASPASDYQ